MIAAAWSRSCSCRDVKQEQAPWPLILLAATGLAALLLLIRLIFNPLDGKADESAGGDVGRGIGMILSVPSGIVAARRSVPELPGVGRQPQGPHRRRQAQVELLQGRRQRRRHRLPRRRHHHRRSELITTHTHRATREQMGSLTAPFVHAFGVFRLRGTATMSAISSPASVGLSPTFTPAAASASILP